MNSSIWLQSFQIVLQTVGTLENGCNNLVADSFDDYLCDLLIQKAENEGYPALESVCFF